MKKILICFLSVFIVMFTTLPITFVNAQETQSLHLEITNNSLEVGQKLTFNCIPSSNSNNLMYSYFILKDGDLVYKALNVASSTFSYVPNSFGTYHIQAYCVDSLGNTISADKNFSVDFFDSNSNFSVHFIDVGQGDCIFIQSNEKNILIDAGNNSKGKNVIVKYLNQIGVNRIDLAIATHPHSDHIGGMDEVMDAIPIDEIFMPELPQKLIPTTATYLSLLTSIDENNVKLSVPYNGQTLTVGEIVLTFYLPLKEYNDLNNMSIITKLDYAGKSYLFMGDAEEPREQELLQQGIDITADVLKVGHHGSDTSSSENFIFEVFPEYAIIMCSAANSYGHPSQMILDRLSFCRIYRTDVSSTIVLKQGKNIIIAIEEN